MTIAILNISSMGIHTAWSLVSNIGRILMLCKDPSCGCSYQSLETLIVARYVCASDGVGDLIGG